MVLLNLWLICAPIVTLIQWYLDRYEDFDMEFILRLVLIIAFGPILILFQLLALGLDITDQQAQKEIKEFLKEYQDKNISLPKNYYPFTKNEYDYDEYYD